jgi:hypothetical protein
VTNNLVLQFNETITGVEFVELTSLSESSSESVNPIAVFGDKSTSLIVTLRGSLLDGERLSKSKQKVFGYNKVAIGIVQTARKLFVARELNDRA